MQLSLLFPFSPAWVERRRDGVFVVGFYGVAPLGFAQWCQSSAAVLGVSGFPSWRSHSAGVAVCLRVSADISAVLSKLPAGRGGSAHPSNALPF